MNIHTCQRIYPLTTGFSIARWSLAGGRRLRPEKIPVSLRYGNRRLRSLRKYDSIKRALRSFPDEEIATPIYEMAASFFNTCRRRGLQGSHTDFLICACAVAWETQILSKDADYTRFQDILPIDLFEVSAM